MAAEVGYMFKIDPLTALHSNMFDWAVRQAATEYIADERQKAYEAQKPKK